MRRNAEGSCTKERCAGRKGAGRRSERGRETAHLQAKKRGSVARGQGGKNSQGPTDERCDALGLQARREGASRGGVARGRGRPRNT